MVGDHRLRLATGGWVTLPVPAVRGHLAGLLRVELPPGIKAGQRFGLDVQQQRDGRILGGFRLRARVHCPDVERA